MRPAPSGSSPAISNQLTKEPVFNRYEAERYLLLASDLPGYTVRLTLRPAGTRARRRHRRRHGPAHAGLCRLQRAERRLARARTVGRARFARNSSASPASATAPAFVLQHVRLPRAADRPGRPRLPPRPGRPEHRRHLHLCLGAARHPRCQGACQDSARTRSRSATRSSAARRETIRGVGRHGLRQPGRQARRDQADPRSPARRVRGSASMRSRPISTGFSPTEPPWHVDDCARAPPGPPCVRRDRLTAGRLGANCLGPNDVPPSRIDGRPTRPSFATPAYGEFRPIPKLTFALGARANMRGSRCSASRNSRRATTRSAAATIPARCSATAASERRPSSASAAGFRERARQAAVEGYAFWDHASVHNRDKLVHVAGASTSTRSAPARASASTASRSTPRSPFR